MVWFFLKFLHVKVNTTIGLVSIPVCNNLLDKLDNFRHVLADTCDHFRQTYVKSPHVIKELSFIFTADLFKRNVRLNGFADDFVVDVSDIHD